MGALAFAASIVRSLAWTAAVVVLGLIFRVQLRDLIRKIAEHIQKWPPVSVTLPWLEPGGKPRTETLIFAGKMRGAIDNTYFNKSVWRPAVEAAGLPASRENGMHALRHFYASTLLRGGVDIKRVSAYLGHSSAAFTLATYIHLLADDEDRSLRDIEAALAASKKSNIALNATEA